MVIVNQLTRIIVEAHPARQFHARKGSLAISKEARQSPLLLPTLVIRAQESIYWFKDFCKQARIKAYFTLADV